MTDTIGFIGGGRITAIFLRAWKAKGLAFDRIIVSDNDPGVLERLRARFPHIETTLDVRASMAQDILFLALHPPVMKTLLPELGPSLKGETMVVSLSPVLTLAQLSDQLEGCNRLVRMIPNAPSLMGKGCNPVTYGPGIAPEDRDRLAPIFAALGQAPEVPEADLEAYVILTAIGPTYFWPQWQVLRDMGKAFGLEPRARDRGLAAMLHGAVDLLFDSGLSFEEVMDTIPAKPLAESQDVILSPFREKLPALYARLKGR